MATITANDLKTKGVSGLEKMLVEAQEVIVSVRGRPRYVVMRIEQYDRLRECEIEAAWHEAHEDIAAGRFRREHADEHIARISAELGDAV